MSDGDRTGPADADGDANADAGAGAAAGSADVVEGTVADGDPADDPDGETVAASATDDGDLESGDRAPPDGNGDVDLSAAPGPGDGLVTLHPRVRLVWIVQTAISAAVLGAIVGVGGLVTLGDPWPGVAAGVLALVLGCGHAVLRYRVWRYEVREESLYLERGVFTRVTTIVPYVRIQHVDASRGPVERLAGLATAVVYTAGSRGADVSIPGLTPESAEALQRRLERLAIAAEGEDAV